MKEDERKSPEELLLAVKREERLVDKGRLKIFFGMSAGVGKTYAMLEEARTLQASGVKVVVGIVETHGRQETAELLKGLPVIPEKVIDYKEKEFKELDLDAIIQQHPDLVLIDELAHSNIPGLRHEKRWQDILEVLDHGIDVYTTLNVQHIESLNDTVRDITEISVKETVPDSVIERASAIQFIDLTPEELLQRLQEGKVYLGPQSQVALSHFFKKDRLTALREIALRYAAETVDRDLQYSIPTSERLFNWKPREKLLVAVGPSPHSLKLIRSTKRLASGIKAPWVAVYVNTGRELSEKDQRQLAKNLQVANDLGAEMITVNDPDIAEGIERTARQKRVTQIIIGRTPKGSFWDLFRRDTLLDKLASQCVDIDFHIFRQEEFPAVRKRPSFSFRRKSSYLSYGLAAAITCLIASISWLILGWIDYRIVGALFLVSTLAMSLAFTRGPIFLSSLLFAAIWAFFFIPPKNSFEIYSTTDVLLLLFYVLTGTITGILVDRGRAHKKMLIESEESIHSLFDISQLIAASTSMQKEFGAVKDKLQRRFHGEFEIVGKEINDGLPFEKVSNLLSGNQEWATALWVFENGKEAGFSTDTLPSSQNLYIPLKGYDEVVGLLIFKPDQRNPLSIEEKNFLYNVSRQIANQLEHVFSDERIKQHEQLQQIENIQKTILNRFALEFNAPLNEAKLEIEEWKKHVPRSELKSVEKVEGSLRELERFLSNISAMAQLSEGMVPLETVRQPIGDVIEFCVSHIKNLQKEREIVVHIEQDLPPIPFDFYLVQILLHNLVINAIQYTPKATTITIEAKRVEDTIAVSVSDQGNGIPQQQLEPIFEKFYRGPDAPSHGIGLGLAIARTIAELHGGVLLAENNPQSGAKFTLFLPLR